MQALIQEELAEDIQIINDLAALEEAVEEAVEEAGTAVLAQEIEAMEEAEAGLPAEVIVEMDVIEPIGDVLLEEEGDKAEEEEEDIPIIVEELENAEEEEEALSDVVDSRLPGEEEEEKENEEEEGSGDLTGLESSLSAVEEPYQKEDIAELDFGEIQEV